MKLSIKTKDICIIALLVAVTAIFSQITIPLPFTPVPITLGALAVYSTGILLKPSHAFLTQLIYLLVGAIGLPVFSGARGGFSVLAGPTGGYLIAYPIMAFFIAITLTLLENKKPNISPYLKRIVLLFALILSQIFCYLLGSLWLSTLTQNTFQQSLVLGVYPFIIGDFIKMLISILILLPLRKRLQNRGLL